jgi:hypothetical protein
VAAVAVFIAATALSVASKKQNYIYVYTDWTLEKYDYSERHKIISCCKTSLIQQKSISIYNN